MAAEHGSGMCPPLKNLSVETTPDQFGPDPANKGRYRRAARMQQSPRLVAVPCGRRRVKGFLGLSMPVCACRAAHQRLPGGHQGGRRGAEGPHLQGDERAQPGALPLHPQGRPGRGLARAAGDRGRPARAHPLQGASKTLNPKPSTRCFRNPDVQFPPSALICAASPRMCLVEIAYA